VRGLGSLGGLARERGRGIERQLGRSGVVRGGDAPQLVAGGREIYTTIQHVMEEARVSVVVRGLGVREGSVELFGNILDERLRKALRVLVENVPGVRAVHDHIVLLEPYSGREFASPEDKMGPESTADRESVKISPQKAVSATKG